ncbi:MAG: GNAT family N-acetyltransferase [Mesorhizobium sp.]|uniref:GNAT family N-acetyltransferase n=1 Tax=Mesorhizobium sp. TaxID=1871066 RepID=UPI00120E25E9|nr:GNAT family N-acetyltransferase [Mesorhizobium sp.]TIP01698.1 MAG: GNAT family N-acetyltransferase [Mesorhizobium sp.]
MDGSCFTIRHIQADEVDAFRRIRLEALRLEPSFYASSYEDCTTLSVEEWQQRLSDSVFVAFRDDEPVGIIGLHRQRASKMAHRATISMVYIRKNLRGTGLAGYFLNTIADFARGIGILQLELSVSAENEAAIRFYLREGFLEVGRIPGGLLHEGREIDDVLMVSRLIA